MHGSNGVLVAIIVFSILWLIDFYVFQAVKTAISGWDKIWAKNLITYGYWVLSIGLPATVIIGFLTMSGPPKGNSMAGMISNLLITFFATKATILLFVLGEDIFRIGQVTFQWIQSKVGDNNSLVEMPSRRKFISQAAILTAAIPFASFLYGVTKGKYRYTVHRKTLYFDDLPDAFDGFTITQISDVHAGSFDDKEAVKHGIDVINQQKSDLFVFTGDLVNDNADEFDDYKDIFSQIKAPYGQYSILGNHDYSEYGNWSESGALENRAKIRQHHADVGFNLLLNDSTYIEKDGQKLALLGMENWGVGFSKYGDLEQTLGKVDKKDFKVLLSHDPTHFDEQVKTHENPIHLTLSGHTHGMQVGVEIPGLRWSPSKLRYKRWADLFQENGRYLYVNRGFGFIGFSGRVGIWPEITVLELKKNMA